MKSTPISTTQLSGAIVDSSAKTKSPAPVTPPSDLRFLVGPSPTPIARLSNDEVVLRHPTATPVDFQMQGGPIVTVKHRAAFLTSNGNRLVLVSDTQQDAAFRLPENGVEGQMAVAVQQDNARLSCLVDLCTSFQFDYLENRFVVFDVVEKVADESPPEWHDEEVGDSVSFDEAATETSSRGALA